jgi:hypothetical protein
LPPLLHLLVRLVLLAAAVVLAAEVEAPEATLVAEIKKEVLEEGLGERRHHERKN